MYVHLRRSHPRFGSAVVRIQSMDILWPILIEFSPQGNGPISWELLSKHYTTVCLCMVMGLCLSGPTETGRGRLDNSRVFSLRLMTFRHQPSPLFASITSNIPQFYILSNHSQSSSTYYSSGPVGGGGGWWRGIPSRSWLIWNAEKHTKLIDEDLWSSWGPPRGQCWPLYHSSAQLWNFLSSI